MPSPVTARQDPNPYPPNDIDESVTCHAPTRGVVGEPIEDLASAAAPVRTRFDVADSDDELGFSASLLNGRQVEHGIELDVFSVGARTSSAEDEGHATLAHLGVSSSDGRSALRGEIFTASARSGTENVDGSAGVHLGAGAAIATVESTLPLGAAGSVTVGANFGVGASASVGIRDVDGDGRTELCGRVEYLFAIAGLCVENPFAR